MLVVGEFEGEHCFALKADNTRLQLIGKESDY